VLAERPCRVIIEAEPDGAAPTTVPERRPAVA